MAAKAPRIELNSDGFIDLLKSEGVERYLMAVGEEMRVEAEKVTGGEFFAEPHYARKTRTVVNVGAVDDGANYREAATGDLARIASKPRNVAGGS